MSIDLEALPLGDDAPGVVNVVIEIPVGSRNKYEWSPELGLIMRDRVPRFDDIRAVGDLPDQNLREIEQFIEVYKQLEGDEGAEVHGWLLGGRRGP